MMKKTLTSLVLWLTLVSAAAAAGTIYIDTGGCQTGSTTLCSGTTDSATATVSGASATITCSATDGPAGAPGCSLSGTPDLSGVATDGSQAIFLNCATNSNQKIFWINAINDGSDLVGTTVTPTGCTAASSDWGIGGRMIFDSAKIEAAVRPGDTIEFNNTPAAKGATFFTVRVSGDSAGGFINFRGKTGVRPVLATSNASVVLAGTNLTSWRVSNLEFQRGGTSLNVLNQVGNNWIIDNIKITSAPTAGIGISGGNLSTKIINSEITGVGGDAISFSTSTLPVFISGNYIHGNGGNGITLTSAQSVAFIQGNIIASNTGRGIYLSGATTTLTEYVAIVGNTIYNNSDSGLEVADADQPVHLVNNIFQSTGTPFNVEWAAGNAELTSYHACNTFYISAGSNNVTGLTINATENTNNPNLTNPGGGDFSINTSSSAAGTGCPNSFLGASTNSYPDQGAASLQAGSVGNQLRMGIGR